MERQLVRDYELLIDELLPHLTAEKLELAVRLASLPEKIRGYGHVKLANVASAKAQWQDLLDRFHGRKTEVVAEAPVRVIRMKGVAEL